MPPELIQSISESGAFTNKVDIWALGCILYRIIFSSEAFTCDRALYDYCKTQGDSLGLSSSAVEICSIFTNEQSAEFITELLLCLLEIEPTRRPSAKQILRDLQSESQRCGGLDDVVQDTVLRREDITPTISSTEQIVRETRFELNVRPSARTTVQDTQFESVGSGPEGTFEGTILEMDEKISTTPSLQQFTQETNSVSKYYAIYDLLKNRADRGEETEYLHKSTSYGN